MNRMHACNALCIGLYVCYTLANRYQNFVRFSLALIEITLILSTIFVSILWSVTWLTTDYCHSMVVILAVCVYIIIESRYWTGVTANYQLDRATLRLWSSRVRSLRRQYPHSASVGSLQPYTGSDSKGRLLNWVRLAGSGHPIRRYSRRTNCHAAHWGQSTRKELEQYRRNCC